MWIYLTIVLCLLTKENAECNAVKYRALQCVTVDNKKLTVSNVIGHT